MGIEIERRFLVNGNIPEGEVVEIRQGYLSSDPDRAVRIRIAGDEAWLTIKARREGFTRAEFEYPIPLADAIEMFHCTTGNDIEKTRYRIPLEGHLWEVDVFHGANDGLVIAEVELASEDEEFSRPDWLGEEVTSNARYTNAMLSKHPFVSWK